MPLLIVRTAVLESHAARNSNSPGLAIVVLTEPYIPSKVSRFAAVEAAVVVVFGVYVVTHDIGRTISVVVVRGMLCLKNILFVEPVLYGALIANHIPSLVVHILKFISNLI